MGAKPVTEASAATDRAVAPRAWRTVSLLLVLLATLFGVLAAYQAKRQLTVDVGSLGDTPFVANFNADEADISYRYRWSKAHSEVTFIGAGSAAPSEVVIRAQGARPQGGSQPVTMSVSLNGVALDPPVVTLTQQVADYAFAVPPGKVGSDAVVLALDASTFRAPGDARELGVKVDSATLRQDAGDFNLPPLWLLLWSLLFTAGLFGLFSWLQGPKTWLLPFIASAFGLAGLISALWLSVLYVAVYFPPVAAAAGIAGLVVWQRERLGRWPLVVDRLGTWRVAALVMGASMLVYAVVALWAIPQVDWIGHADYAENAVIARNFVQGRGLTVDYIAQFYRTYSDISHPAETWPLLQPLLIAPFFALLGPLTWVAKLPNLFLLLALAWAVFYAGSRIWDARAGLVAGLLTLVHPYFFNTVLYPINDLAFTLIFFLLAWSVWRQISPMALPQAVEAGAFRRFDMRSAIAAGVLAGLLVWSKPSGASLIVGLALWAAWTWLRSYRREGVPLPWRAIAAAGGAAALVLLPLLIRNLLAFGKPFFSTESYDAWILRYWPQHNWEDIYKVYAGGELPALRWVVGGKFGYQNLLAAIATNFGWVWQKGVLGTPGQGEFVFGLSPLSGAIVGLAALTRRAASLFAMVGLSLTLYSLFVLVYWHFEGRYFQVVVPWLYMLLAWAIFWVWDRLRESPLSGGWRKAGLLVLPLAVAGFLWPSIGSITSQLQADLQPTGYVKDMAWLKANSTARDVVMTRDPWELNWYTERRAVMIPNDDLATIEKVMKQYGVTMLQLGGPADGVDRQSCPKNPQSSAQFPTGSRPALNGLYCGQARSGYKLVYQDGDITIYRLSSTPQEGSRSP